MADPVSVILIQIDSLNRHFLPVYGNTWIKAPNLTAFAQNAVVFDNHYTGSLPCMPARREIWAGSEEFWWRWWGPLEPWDQPLAHLANRQGIITQLITDHYHLFEWGSHNYPYDYDGYEFIRGHEYDNWRTDPPASIPDWAVKMVERLHPDTQQYLRNAQDFVREEDFFAPQVMTAVSDWLDRNHAQKQFFVHVDCFDVHEPFHVPEPYRSMYTDADYRLFNPWPMYGRVDSGASALPDEEIEWVRAQFAGKLTMVDTWLGRVLEKLHDYRLMERTAVIITTDHGHYLGDHGWMGKPNAPLYHTLCHIPLMVWHPGSAKIGQRVTHVTQTVDLYATVLELLGVEAPAGEHLHSRSFAPTITGDVPSQRDYAVYGYNNRLLGLTAGEWTLLRDFDDEAAAAYIYTHQVEHLNGFSNWTRKHWRRTDYCDLQAGRFIPGVDMPVWRMTRQTGPTMTLEPRRPDLLFHNPTDPAQETNLADQRPEVVAGLERLLRHHMQTLGVPEEQFQRLRL